MHISKYSEYINLEDYCVLFPKYFNCKESGKYWWT